jgi:ribonuclease HII
MLMSRPDTETPTLQHEMRLWQAGMRFVAGIDEAGRGALAGPVAAAAVIVPPDAAFAGVWVQVRDSKLLSPIARTELAAAIRSAALSWGVGMASAEEIDAMGIAPATRLAMQRAVEALRPRPDYLLIDWVKLPQINIRQESRTKADRTIVSVAAASILAKVSRDEALIRLDRIYPDYGFASHKGYGAAAHLAALERCGPCPEHRHSFAPIARRPSLFDEALRPGERPTGSRRPAAGAH